MLARVVGEVDFDGEVKLVVQERIIDDRLSILIDGIDGYDYEIWRGNEKLY